MCLGSKGLKRERMREREGEGRGEEKGAEESRGELVCRTASEEGLLKG